VAGDSVEGVAGPRSGDSVERVAGPRSRKGARTRERLLEAAKQVFEDDGFLDGRISDIAQRAGLSHGSFYYYFDSKEEIFREVAAAVDEQLSAPLGEVVLDPASPLSPADRLREAIRRHFESYRDEARILGMIEEVSRYDDEVASARRARHQRYTAQIADSIRTLQRRGQADPGLDPVVAATALGALTSQFGEMWLVQGTVECTLDEAVDQVSRLLVNVLGVDAAATEVLEAEAAGAD
jgi:AcrR family transcriptional regulator